MQRLIEGHRAEFKKSLKNTLLVVLGTSILAMGTGLFILPFDLVTGGVSGMGIIVARLFSLASFLPNVHVDVYVSVINWILFFLGLIFLGKSFAMKTLVSTAIYPVVLSFSVLLSSGEVLGGFFNLNSAMYTEYGEITRILATVFGGASVGAGAALTFLGGGSSGGVDIIAFIICKYAKKLKSSLVMFAIDATIVTFGVFVIGDLVVSLLGIISAFICAITIDRLFIGESGAFIAHIVSDRYEDINLAIIKRLDRTSTIVNCTGGYSGDVKKMLICTFGFRQYAEFCAIIDGIDRFAFVTVHRAHQINGEGWSYDVPK